MFYIIIYNIQNAISFFRFPDIIKEYLIHPLPQRKTMPEMNTTITIKKKTTKGEDGYRIISVRMKEELVQKLDNLSSESNRSRNELINTLLESAIEIVRIEN